MDKDLQVRYIKSENKRLIGENESLKKMNELLRVHNSEIGEHLYQIRKIEESKCKPLHIKVDTAKDLETWIGNIDFNGRLALYNEAKIKGNLEITNFLEELGVGKRGSSSNNNNN